MRNFKKFLALGLATALVITPMSVTKADTVTGNSNLEGVPPEDVVSVVLPTIAADTYDFILDPSDLLSQYDASKDDYTPSSIYFPNTTAAKKSSLSDIGTAINKSTCDVLLDVDMKVTNAATNPVTFTAKDAVENDTKLNVYLGLVPTAKGTVVGDGTPTDGAVTSAQAIPVDSTGDASASFLLTGDTDNFDVTQTADASVASGHKYSYDAKATATWSTAGFALEGSCNTTADWKDYNEKSQLLVGGENLKVSVVYTMNPLTTAQKTEIEGGVTADSTTSLIALSKTASAAAPLGFTNSSYTYKKGTALTIPIDLGSGSLKLVPTSVVVSMQVASQWYDLSSGSFGGSYSNGQYTLAANAGLSVGGPYPLRVVITTASESKTFTSTLTISA